MRKWILIVSCLFVVLLTGCEEFQKLFMKHGQIQLGAGGSGGGSSSSISISNYQVLYSSLCPPGGVVFTIEKVQLTKDGSNWVTLLDNPVEINTENAYTQDSNGGWIHACWSTLTDSMEIDEGDYCALRVWIGPNITAHDNWLEYSTSSVTVRTDFNVKLYPLYITYDGSPWKPDTTYVCNTRQEPFKVERGKRTELVIFIDDYKLISGVVERFEDWASFRDSLSWSRLLFLGGYCSSGLFY